MITISTTLARVIGELSVDRSNWGVVEIAHHDRMLHQSRITFMDGPDLPRQTYIINDLSGEVIRVIAR